MEKQVHGILFHYLEETQPISNYQWDFHAGKSTATASIETTHRQLQLFESGVEVEAIFLDFKKAFDSVPHRALLQKLRDLGVDSFYCGGYRATSLITSKRLWLIEQHLYLQMYYLVSHRDL